MLRLLLFAAFMHAYFNFIDFQLLIVAYALQKIRWRRVIAMAFYMRRRRRICRRLWRLPRPVNSVMDKTTADSGCRTAQTSRTPRNRPKA